MPVDSAARRMLDRARNALLASTNQRLARAVARSVALASTASNQTQVRAAQRHIAWLVTLASTAHLWALRHAFRVRRVRMARGEACVDQAAKANA